MSSEYDSNNRVGNCHDGNNDNKICASASGDKVNPDLILILILIPILTLILILTLIHPQDPWLVFRYRAGTDIRKIVVHNRKSCVCVIRIVGASIRICSDSG